MCTYRSSAYVSIRQHTSAYVSICQHTSAYVSKRHLQELSIRQHTSAYVSIRQHTSAYVSIRHLKELSGLETALHNHLHTLPPPLPVIPPRHPGPLSPVEDVRAVRLGQHAHCPHLCLPHTSAYVSIRQHTAAQVTHAHCPHLLPGRRLSVRVHKFELRPAGVSVFRQHLYFCTRKASKPSITCALTPDRSSVFVLLY